MSAPKPMLQQLADWLDDRDAIHALAVEWPPASKVRAQEGRVLIAPAPGVIGTITSYFEDGSIGVAAPMAATVVSPITGETAEVGEVIQGNCEAEWLELVEFGPFTPDDVRSALALLQGADDER